MNNKLSDSTKRGRKLAANKHRRDADKELSRACGADYAKPLAKSYCDECVHGDVIEQEDC